jgi:hypothetical protein
MVERRRARAQAVLFWASTIVFGASSFGVVAILSRRVGAGELAEVSAVFALSYLMTILPSSEQLRAAGLVGAGHGIGSPPWRPVIVVVAVLGLAAPLLERVLALPVLAVVAVALQLVPGLPLAIRRGTLIGSGHMWGAGSNFALEAVCRFGLGLAFGATWGSTGVAWALLTAIVIALVASKVRIRVSSPREPEPASLDSVVTPFAGTVASIGLMMLLVGIDLIVAPGALDAVSADRYALAAVPAKGVYGALFAVGLILIPTARRGRSRSLKAIAATMAAGIVGAGVLVLVRPLIPIVFGRTEPDPLLLGIVGVAMAAAAGTSACVHVAVARGFTAPWPPLLIATGAIVIVAVAAGTPLAFGVGVLAAQSVAFAASLAVVAFS